MKQFIDRSDPIAGENRTARDFRQAPTSMRLIENFDMPDGRLRRRRGFSSVNQPVKTQALVKATGIQFNKKLIESDHTKGTVATTPLSYGLVKWHEAMQLRNNKSTTIEFCLRIGEKDATINSPFLRFADTTGPWGPTYLIRSGAYIYDQTIISNGHVFNDGVVIDGATVPGAYHDLTALAGPTLFDAFPLTGVAFFVNSSGIFCDVGLIENTGVHTGAYWLTQLGYVFPSGYNEGDIYHVALVFDHDIVIKGRLSLYINGVFVQKVDLPTGFDFAGHSDLINGVTYATGQKRDTVILNECTVRGSYSSACKIRADMHGHQTFYGDYAASPNDIPPNPWAMSPPRGTAMWDLRVWNEARSSVDLLANAFKRIQDDTGLPNLADNWHLNDGGPICVNHTTPNKRVYCTVHHGYPGYINDDGFLGSLGIKLADGQHLIKSVGANDRFYGSGLAAQLDNFLAGDATAGYLAHRDQHSFSVMMQIMVPAGFQAELNDDATAPANMKDLALVETRRNMNTGCFADYDTLLDGTAETGALSRNAIGHATDPAVGPNIHQHLRAYDQTLWSIEGTQQKDDTVAATNESNRRRIPLARGVLTPAGKVAFELFKMQTGGAQPKYLRLLSASTLSVDTVYTLTFVQRVAYVYDAVTDKLDASGWVMEIWIKNITAGTAAVLDSTHTVAAASTITTGPLVHQPDYDIIIGASYVNDGWDHSINMPFPGGVVATPKTSYVPAPSTKRENHGPWPVQQRFMSPYQDQPGNFILGMFRLWSNSLSAGGIDTYSGELIATKDQTTDLLVNLEITEITGVKVPNKTKYPDTFDLGFKSWGMPQGYREKTYLILSGFAYLKKELFEGTWAYEDCLGYMPVSSPDYDPGSSRTTVTGLTPFRSLKNQQFGLLSVFDDAPAYDADLSGTFTPLFVSNHGLMSEFVPGSAWRGTVVGNRTILTSQFALPKSFDGRICTVAGFKRWNGGIPVAYETSAVPASLTAGWYGVVLVYFSEALGTYQVSPVATCRVVAANAIGLFMVPQHPDPRVTLVEVYRTLPQASEALALVAPLFKTNMGSGGSTTVGAGGGNVFAEAITIRDADAYLSTAVLDRNVTEIPACAFSAALDNQLYLGGDPLNPDTIYTTDPGNPERIDAIAGSFDLPESGDVITGMVAAFNAVFVFQQNSIWQIVDIGGNRKQINKVAYVGAISERSIQVVTNPDSGRIFIFFWSAHGPYVFDGTTTQYLGSPIEEAPTADEAYWWLDPSSVVACHDEVNRSIICSYTPIRRDEHDELITLDRNGEARVFNYRTSAWYRYSGVVCAQSLTFVFSNNLLSLDKTGGYLRSKSYKLFTGGENGRIYTWGTADFDGVPDGMTLDASYVIDTATNPTFGIPALDYSFDLTGCWVTFVNANNDWCMAPIISFDSTAKTITISEDWLIGSTFTPDTDSVVYLCQPFARIEPAWDELGIPAYDKEVIEMFIWFTKDLYYRARINRNATYDSSWVKILDSSSKRKRVQLKKTVEVLKLELATKEIGATVDGMGFEVDFKQGANTKQ